LHEIAVCDSLSRVKQAAANADTAWRKSRLAARSLIRKESRPLRSREQALARRLSWDLEVTNGIIQQALYFLATLPGLVITKFDGTSKCGMVLAIQRELGLSIKSIGLGEQADDLHPFDAKQFAEALFSEKG